MSHPMPTGEPAIRMLMMPRDTNSHGTIFGGIILSYIDLAGAITARKYAAKKYVTVALDKVEFKEPVYVGDLVSVFGEVTRAGRTSLTIKLTVFAERFDKPGAPIWVTEASAVFVAVGEDGRPTPVK